MTDHADLLSFLTARIDERERIARAACGDGLGRWSLSNRYGKLIDDEDGQVVVYDEGSPGDEQAAHMILWDPENALADLQAKRRILARHAPMENGSCEYCWAGGEYNETGWPCGDVRDLASAYARHPDYRQEWAP